jgi:DNA-binding transcriptional ArsR family regulator
MTVNKDEVFDKAADLFAVMSTPIRLRIISALCLGEKNVGQLPTSAWPSPTCRST